MIPKTPHINHIFRNDSGSTGDKLTSPLAPPATKSRTVGTEKFERNHHRRAKQGTYP
jgi:hypothetical protein